LIAAVPDGGVVKELPWLLIPDPPSPSAVPEPVGIGTDVGGVASGAPAVNVIEEGI